MKCPAFSGKAFSRSLSRKRILVCPIGVVFQLGKAVRNPDGSRDPLGRDIALPRLIAHSPRWTHCDSRTEATRRLEHPSAFGADHPTQQMGQIRRRAEFITATLSLSSERSSRLRTSWYSMRVLAFLRQNNNMIPPRSSMTCASKWTDGGSTEIQSSTICRVQDEAIRSICSYSQKDAYPDATF